LINGTAEFWRDVYEVFMDRDMTRQEVRHLITRGLAIADGSYRELLHVLRLAGEDYKRLLNFLVRHECAVDFRPFRPGLSSKAREKVRGGPHGIARHAAAEVAPSKSSR
jgi:hypothetical protein